MLSRRAFAASSAAGLLIPSRSAAQRFDVPSSDVRLYAEGRYLPKYIELKSAAANGEDPGGLLSQYAAFVGDEDTAIGTDERLRESEATLPDLSNARAQEAVSAIAAAAADAQVVILNEAHNVSGHRAFAAKVLRALRPLGFDIFAAETFIAPQEEPAASIRTFSAGGLFHSGFGYYTLDPVFAEVVREAAELGYQMVDYEQRPNQRLTGSPDERIAAREEAQADNLIEAVLSRRPDARIFVLCGFSHAMEVAGRGGLWFAARLKAKTGLDPLTIEQSLNWPATQPQYDRPHVSAVLERFAPRNPIVVTNSGVMTASPAYEGKMDMSVFHPRLPPVEGRPGWLAGDPRRRQVNVDLPLGDGLRLLQAFHLAEGSGSIPADQVLVQQGISRATLFLRAGAYALRMEAIDGVQPVFATVDVAAT